MKKELMNHHATYSISFAASGSIILPATCHQPATPDAFGCDWPQFSVNMTNFTASVLDTTPVE